MEVINKIQRKILGSFNDVPGSEYFYLAGGTALAEFYLRHRKSEDLDFFSGIEELIGPFSFRLEKILIEKGMGVAFQRIKTFKEDSPGMLLLAAPITFDKLRGFYKQWSAEIAEKIKPEQS